MKLLIDAVKIIVDAFLSIILWLLIIPGVSFLTTLAIGTYLGFELNDETILLIGLPVTIGYIWIAMFVNRGLKRWSGLIK